MPPLLAVPNVSEGRNAETLARLEQAFGREAELLDRHSDADHDRTVFTLARRYPGRPDADHERDAEEMEASVM
jgi:glutamate formiminotransferase